MNGKVWNLVNTKSDNPTDRLIDIQIPEGVMNALYIPIDSKVFIIKLKKHIKGILKC